MAKNDKEIKIWCVSCGTHTAHNFNPHRFDYPDAPFFVCKECSHNKVTQLSIQWQKEMYIRKKAYGH